MSSIIAQTAVASSITGNMGEVSPKLVPIVGHTKNTQLFDSDKNRKQPGSADKNFTINADGTFSPYHWPTNRSYWKLVGVETNPGPPMSAKLTVRTKRVQIPARDLHVLGRVNILKERIIRDLISLADLVGSQDLDIETLSPVVNIVDRLYERAESALSLVHSFTRELFEEEAFNRVVDAEESSVREALSDPIPFDPAQELAMMAEGNPFSVAHPLFSSPVLSPGAHIDSTTSSSSSLLPSPLSISFPAMSCNCGTEDCPSVDVPAAPLVCVEPNPGPLTDGLGADYHGIINPNSRDPYRNYNPVSRAIGNHLEVGFEFLSPGKEGKRIYKPYVPLVLPKTKHVPSAPLVGVETNPGPKTKNMHQKRKTQARKQPRQHKETRVVSKSVTHYSAPTALGYIMRNPALKFGPTKHGRMSGLKVSGRQYVCAISTATSNFAPSFGVTGSYSAQDTYIALDVNGSGDTGAANYLTPTGSPLSNLALSFARFLFRKAKFYYEAGCASTTLGTMTLAYAADAASYNYSNTTNSTKAVLATLQDNVTFSAWKDAEFNCTAISDFKEPLYDLGTGSTGVTNSRNGAQGCLLISAGSALSTAQNLGDLDLEYEVDMFDSGSFSTSGVGLSMTSATKIVDACRRHGYIVTMPGPESLSVTDPRTGVTASVTPSDTAATPVEEKEDPVVLQADDLLSTRDLIASLETKISKLKTTL
jgi:hypothetical protein